MEPNYVWCPYAPYVSLTQTPSTNKNNNSTVVDGQIPPAQRNYDANSQMPPVPRHGGLFSSPPSNNPWNSIPVTPTMTNYIQNNLRSANPPPGATEQYVGTNRLGNNYVAMPGVYWYNPPGMENKYSMMVTHECEARSYDQQGGSIVGGPQQFY